MSKWYGSVQNRIEENRMLVDEIKVGTGMTEYLWSDCTPYEVVEVADQKHIKVRRMGHELVGDAFTNKWRVFSDERYPAETMTKRGKYWYFTSEYEEDGKTKRAYHRANVTFGVARYYYDYSF